MEDGGQRPEIRGRGEMRLVTSAAPPVGGVGGARVCFTRTPVHAQWNQAFLRLEPVHALGLLVGVEVGAVEKQEIIGLFEGSSLGQPVLCPY